jgi:hypothetical protein
VKKFTELIIKMYTPHVTGPSEEVKKGIDVLLATDWVALRPVLPQDEKHLNIALEYLREIRGLK